jgi:hypothetical protein
MRRFVLAAGFCMLGSGVAFGAELILGDAQRGAELLPVSSPECKFASGSRYRGYNRHHLSGG